MAVPVDRVSAAMETVHRSDFLCVAERRYAALDRPLPIGHGGTNSQPTTVANMLRLLDVQPACVVLDVGAGSGWTTALLAELAGDSGRVIGTELVPALAEFGAGNLHRRGTPSAALHRALDGVLGWPDAAPYDRILVSAMAKSMPAVLIDQLAPGGRMVIPVSGQMLLVRRTADGIQTSRHGRYRFVPLVD